MILIIDNYDSFTYNLYQYLGEMGADPLVRRNDAVSLQEVEGMGPERIVLSPGPGHPANRRDFGVCADILGSALGRIAVDPHDPGCGAQVNGHASGCREMEGIGIGKGLADVPILGVCLGHQGIIHHMGGQVGKAREPMHGKSSPIEHDGEGLFKGLANPLTVMRYHSLIGSRIPRSLDVRARTLDGQEVMAVQVKGKRIYGVQFHPESIMTEGGKDILSNFLRC